VTQAPYAPPAADLARARAQGPFFAVSTAKLVILSLTTLNYYQFWWHYKNWAAIRARGDEVSPFWRGFFGQFTCYGLFVRLEAAGRRDDLRMWPGPDICTIAYLLAYLPAWLLFKFPPWPFVSYLSVLALLPANDLARRLNEWDEPTAPAVVPWSWLNVAWVLLIGGPSFVLTIFRLVTR
jgi:hypothetical protein